MENKLQAIYATFSEIRDIIDSGLQQVAQGAGEVATSWTTIVEADAPNDPSELSTVRDKLLDAHVLAYDAAQVLPQIVHALNRYVAALGLPALEEVSTSPSTLEAGRPHPLTSSLQGSAFTQERPRPESAPTKSHDYDIIVVPGSAFNFEKNRFPDHVYKSLDDAAAMYEQGKSAGGIVLCGRGAMKDIAQGRMTAESEARLMQRYLTSKGIDPDAIALEEASTNTPENFLFFKRMAELHGWKRAYLPTAAGRVARVALLGAKICYRQCSFDIRSLECNTAFPEEPKLFGDQVCALQEMDWGDDTFITHEPGGASKWKDISDEHHSCQFYVSSGKAKPGHNYHPDSLMREFGTPPAGAVIILK